MSEYKILSSSIERNFVALGKTSKMKNIMEALNAIGKGDNKLGSENWEKVRVAFENFGFRVVYDRNMAIVTTALFSAIARSRCSELYDNAKIVINRKARGKCDKEGNPVLTDLGAAMLAGDGKAIFDILNCGTFKKVLKQIGIKDSCTNAYLKRMSKISPWSNLTNSKKELQTVADAFSYMTNKNYGEYGADDDERLNIQTESGDDSPDKVRARDDLTRKIGDAVNDTGSSLWRTLKSKWETCTSENLSSEGLRIGLAPGTVSVTADDHIYHGEIFFRGFSVGVTEGYDNGPFFSLTFNKKELNGHVAEIGWENGTWKNRKALKAVVGRYAELIAERVEKLIQDKERVVYSEDGKLSKAVVISKIMLPALKLEISELKKKYMKEIEELKSTDITYNVTTKSLSDIDIKYKLHGKLKSVPVEVRKNDTPEGGKHVFRVNVNKDWLCSVYNDAVKRVKQDDAVNLSGSHYTAVRSIAFAIMGKVCGELVDSRNKDANYLRAFKHALEYELRGVNRRMREKIEKDTTGELKEAMYKDRIYPIDTEVRLLKDKEVAGHWGNVTLGDVYGNCPEEFKGVVLAVVDLNGVPYNYMTEYCVGLPKKPSFGEVLCSGFEALEYDDEEVKADKDAPVDKGYGLLPKAAKRCAEAIKQKVLGHDSELRSTYADNQRNYPPKTKND